VNFTVEFLDEALRDAEEATEYYENRAPGLGLRFRKELETVCFAVVRQPLLWRQRFGGHRRANFPGFPIISLTTFGASASS
jgi:plasmid stabilization system protein ParE